MSNKDWATQVEDDIRQLFDARRKIETSLINREREVVEKFDIKDKDIDSSVWNDYGIWFLRTEDYSSAECVYECLLNLNKHLVERR